MKTSVKGLKTSKSSAKDKSKKGKHTELVDEFIQVMQPRTRGPSWKDTDPVAQLTASTSIDATVDAVKKSKKAKEKESATGDEVSEQPGEPEVSKEPLSDIDWLRRHTTSTLDSVDAPRKVFEQSDDERMDEDEDKDETEVCPRLCCFPSCPTQGELQAAAEPHLDPAKAAILQTSRLFLRNLTFACTEDEIRDLFQSHGDVSQVCTSMLISCALGGRRTGW